MLSNVALEVGYMCNNRAGGRTSIFPYPKTLILLLYDPRTLGRVVALFSTKKAPQSRSHEGLVEKLSQTTIKNRCAGEVHGAVRLASLRQ